MSGSASTLPLTVADYYKLPADDGKLWELLDGELILNAAPTTRHQRVSRRLLYALMSQLEPTSAAEVFNAPMDVVLSNTTVVEPDLLIVGTARSAIITERAIEGAPDVLIEILSPSTSG